MSAKASSKQTKNTTTKETKEPKEIKKEVTEPEPVESTSDMEEQDIHSLRNGIYKSNPNKAENFRDTLDLLHKHIVDDDGYYAILKLVWGESREALDSLITKANKREKKKVATFQPKGYKKPSNCKNLFDKQFKIDCDKKGIKFSLTDCAAAWQKLSEKEKNKFKKQAADDKAKSDIEFDKLRDEAIMNGEFPEPKPKGPCTAYLQFVGEVRPSLTIKNEKANITGTAANLQIANDASVLWHALSDDAKAKYTLAYKKQKVEYDQKIIEWKARVASRIKTSGDASGASNDASSDEVNIESTGNSKKTTKTTKTTKDSKKKVEVIEDIEAIEDEGANSDAQCDEEVPLVVTKGKGKGKGKAEAEVPAPVVKKTNDKKSKTNNVKVKVESDQEEILTVDEEDHVEEEPIVSKPKAKKTNNKKVIKVESSDNDE